jgi:nucleoside-diphosphate-sugar epimerase
VDDLVSAVLAAFEKETAPGEAFNINGSERPTWHEYFRALNDSMGLPPLSIATPAHARLKAAAVLPFRKTAKVVATHFLPQIMRVAASSPLAREAMVRAESLIRTTPMPTEFAVYSKKVSFSTAKAEKLLGFRPRFPLAEALPLTSAWLRHHGFIQPEAS